MDNFDENLDNVFQVDEPIVIKKEKIMDYLETQIISKTFIFVCIAFFIAAFSAFCVSTLGIGILYFGGKLIMVTAALQIGMVFVGKFAINNDNTILAAIIFVVYSYLFGINLGMCFGRLTNAMIVSSFVIVGIVFLVMGIYGLVTDKDMKGMECAFFMMSAGGIITMIVNFFILRWGILYFFINILILMFITAMTTFDIARIKGGMHVTKGKNIIALALYAGFSLCLDFMNILLLIFGITNYKQIFSGMDWKDHMMDRIKNRLWRR